MGITPKQLKTLRDRLDKSSPDAGQKQKAVTQNLVADKAVILGVDPSLRGTGFGKIQVVGNQFEALEFGVVKCPASWPRTRCLGAIQEKLAGLMLESQPDFCVFEGLFYTQNLKTAIIMGEARGVAMAAAGARAVPSYEIAPRKVKQALVGFGAAQKSAVARMVQRMLRLDAEPQADAADALAVALAFAMENKGICINPPTPL